MVYGKSYFRVIGKEVDIIAERVDICPALVLVKAYHKYRSSVSLIWELDDQRQVETPD